MLYFNINSLGVFDVSQIIPKLRSPGDVPRGSSFGEAAEGVGPTSWLPGCDIPSGVPWEATDGGGLGFIDCPTQEKWVTCKHCKHCKPIFWD